MFCDARTTPRMVKIRKTLKALEDLGRGAPGYRLACCYCRSAGRVSAENR